MQFTHKHMIWGFVLVLSVMAISMAMGSPLVDPEYLASLGMGGAFIGNTDEIKQLLEDLGKKQLEKHDEFKTANDARLKAIEEKNDTAIKAAEEQVKKLNEELTQLGRDLAEYAKKAARPAAGSEDDAEAIERKQAFNKFLRKGDDRDYLAALDKKAMNSSSDPDGGVLVLEELDREIDRIAPTVSAMFSLANIKTIGTDTWKKIVKKTGLAMRRVANGAGGGETTPPTYAEVKIEVSTAEVEPWVQNETLEDAFVNLEADLADEAAIGFAEGAGQEFVAGDGVGKARGITAYPVVANASYAWGSVGYIASGKSAAFASVAPADKLIDLQHALKSTYRPGAVWLMNDKTLGVVRQMKDGSGAYYLWQPDPTGSFGGKLLGHPVVVDDNMPDIGAGSLSIAFGNFKRGYTIVNRTGTTVIRDNITTKGTTKFNFRRRFGGGISNFEAIKLMKFATS